MRLLEDLLSTAAMGEMCMAATWRTVEVVGSGNNYYIHYTRNAQLLL